MNSKLLTQIRAGLGLPTAQIDRLISRAPFTYKHYEIPKKSGGKRAIAQPARETKLIQNWLIENVFSALPIHDAATAYRRGFGIRKNAELHANSRYMLKLDFKDFFSSIKYSDVANHLLRCVAHSYEIDDIRRMAMICCLNQGGMELVLGVGSPASPCLSNSIMYKMDEEINSWCIDNQVVYTRYADDLTFTTDRKGICNDVEGVVEVILGALEFPRIKINKKKTVHLSKKSKRMVTGVIINSENSISLGRSRKREISSLIHKFSIGSLGSDDSFRVQGLLGFSLDIEPKFVESMSKKYGHHILDQIFNLRKEKEI